METAFEAQRLLREVGFFPVVPQIQANSASNVHAAERTTMWLFGLQTMSHNLLDFGLDWSDQMLGGNGIAIGRATKEIQNAHVQHAAES